MPPVLIVTGPEAEDIFPSEFQARTSETIPGCQLSRPKRS